MPPLPSFYGLECKVLKNKDMGTSNPLPSLRYGPGDVLCLGVLVEFMTQS